MGQSCRVITMFVEQRLAVWSKTFITIKIKITAFISQTPSRQMDPQAHGKTLQCTKELFYLYWILLPQGHDAAVVSTEYVLHVAMLLGGFIWNFPRTCADGVFSFVWKASVLQEADWSCLNPHLVREHPAPLSSCGIVSLLAIYLYPSFSFPHSPFSLACWYVQVLIYTCRDNILQTEELSISTKIFSVHNGFFHWCISYLQLRKIKLQRNCSFSMGGSLGSDN